MSFGFGAKNANTYLARSVDTNFQFLLSDAASVSVSVTLVAWWLQKEEEDGGEEQTTSLHGAEPPLYIQVGHGSVD